MVWYLCSSLLCFLISNFLLGTVQTIVALPEDISPNMILDLHRSTNEFIDQANQWHATENLTNHIFSQCGNIFLLGGYNILKGNSSLTRNYNNLPFHRSAFITMSFWFLDNWNLFNYLWISVSSQSQEYLRKNIANLTNNHTNWNSNLCGDPTLFDLAGINLTITTPHEDTSLSLKIDFNPPIQATGHFGIRDIKILLSNRTLDPRICGNTNPPNQFDSAFNCNCETGKYKDPPTNQCQPCHESCGTCFGPAPTHCLSCAPNYMYDGLVCFACNSKCETCLLGSLPNQCLSCSDNMYISSNSSCIDTCKFPLASKSIGGNLYCDFPCSESEYLYFNRSCLATCPPHFTKVGSLCAFPCDIDKGEFLYQNASCLQSCPFPFQVINEGGFRYCNFPCPLTQYYYSNGSCLSTCPAPFIKVDQIDFLQCKFPCNTAEYFYSNGSCLTSCDFPYKQRFQEDKKFCEYICLEHEFLYENGSCLPSCVSPMTSKQSSGLNLCQQLKIQDRYYYPEDQAFYPICPYPYKITETDLLLLCNLEINSKDRKQVESIASVSNTIAGITTGGLIAASIISPGDPAIITSALIAKMLEYVRYMNISHSARLELMFKLYNPSAGIMNIGPRMSTDIQSELASQPLPFSFEKYKLHSSFLVNFWEELFSLIILLGILLFLRTIEWTALCSKKAVLHLLFQKARIVTQNLIVIQFYDNYGDIVFFSGLELRTIHFDSTLSSLSFTISLLHLIIGLIVLLIHFKLLKDYQKTKMQVSNSQQPTAGIRLLEKKYQGLKVLYEEFKDFSIVHQGFLLYFAIRSICFSLIIVLLFEHPLAQTIMIIGGTALVFGYIVTKRPFISKINWAQHTSFEIVLFVVNLALLVMTILDLSETGMQGYNDDLSEVIIIGSLICQLLPIVFLVPKSFIEISQFYYYIKRWYRKWLTQSSGKHVQNSITELIETGKNVSIPTEHINANLQTERDNGSITTLPNNADSARPMLGEESVPTFEGVIVQDAAVSLSEIAMGSRANNLKQMERKRSRHQEQNLAFYGELGSYWMGTRYSYRHRRGTEEDSRGIEMLDGNSKQEISDSEPNMILSVHQMPSIQSVRSTNRPRRSVNELRGIKELCDEKDDIVTAYSRKRANRGEKEKMINFEQEGKLSIGRIKLIRPDRVTIRNQDDAWIKGSPGIGRNDRKILELENEEPSPKKRRND